MCIVRAAVILFVTLRPVRATVGSRRSISPPVTAAFTTDVETKSSTTGSAIFVSESCWLPLPPVSLSQSLAFNHSE